MIPEPEWTNDAACRVAVRAGEAKIDDWFPRTTRGRKMGNLSPSLERAVRCCAGCPVREVCLEEYMKEVPGTSRIGLWGGVLFGYGRNPTDGARGRRLVA